MFASLVTGPPPGLRLDRACALMADAFTGRDSLDAVADHLDRLSAGVRDHSFEGVLASLARTFSGNRRNYADPRNSFIDDVLVRRVGLPITLSVVVMEVGRRVDVDVVGIGLPGHFIVRDGRSDLYGDLFDGGRLLRRADLVSAWSDLVGVGTPFDELHLAPVNERMILIRMLNNLRGLYLPGDHARALYSLAIMRGAFAELAGESSQYARWVRTWN